MTASLIGQPAVTVPTPCVPGPTTLCLNGGRFKVEGTFNTGTQAGQAQVVKLTDETGYFWFFSDTNVEMVIKVLNGCTLNQSFWVFAGGLTNVQTTLTVTDSNTGTVRTYSNPQARPSCRCRTRRRSRRAREDLEDLKGQKGHQGRQGRKELKGPCRPCSP